MTVTKSALTELAAAGLIERKRQSNFQPSRIYVKLPNGQMADKQRTNVHHI